MKTAERKKSAKALLIQHDNQILITKLDCCYLSRGAQEKTAIFVLIQILN